ncbi:MAG: universal stress protein, partial [Pseudomonadota bacterium]
AEDAVLTVKGDLTACAVSVAAQIDAQLIVFSELEGLGGREVTAMVEDTGISVMLSRTAMPSNAVVAATDMTLREFPVLRKGAVVAERLGAPLTVVHNLEPQVSPPAMIAADGTAFLPVMPLAERAKVRTRRATRLKTLGSKLPSVQTTILQESDTVNAVLGLAKSQQADLVIVGHRRRSWLGRVLGESVARGVVNRSVRSVLVVPIDK